MTKSNQKLYNTIENLPEDLTLKVFKYIDFLTFSNQAENAPKNLIIKDKKDLLKKIEEGKKDFDNGNTCSLDEAYNEVIEILNK